MKKRTISFMLVFALIVQICTIPVQANILQYIFYEDFENNVLPTSFAYEKSFGKIEVCKIGTRNALFLNHDYDGTAMYATANFEAINDGTLTAKAIVMQPDKKSDGEVLFSLFDNTGVAISVETQNGNIMLKKADGTYTLIEENYFYNKWYTISAEANLVTDTADVYINGQLKIDDEPFINQMSSVSGIQFSSKTAPGFMIDSVELSNETYFAGFEILGKAEQAVPLHEAIDYIYSANLKTTGGLEAKTNFVWKLVSPVDGVSITANENSKTAKLTVEPRVAIGTEITIEASVEGQPQANSTFTVKLIEASASEIVIEGDSHISTPVGKKTEFFYQATVFDQFKNKVEGESISWSLENNTSATIDFSIENKSMSVSGTMPDKDEFIYLTASLTSNPSIKATKKILIQPYDLYFSDVQRMDIVQKSIDNLLKAASAKESDSPLLALYFSPYTDTYGTWHWVGGYTNLSDLSEHFGLMRALKGLTGLTGDEKYYNRVNAIYDWTWEKCKTPNGLIYWGNHLFCDVETGLPDATKAAAGAPSEYHEVKTGDFYFEPLDDATVVEFCKNYWLATIRDWKDYNFSRHGYVRTKATEETWQDESLFSPSTEEIPMAKSTSNLPFPHAGACLLNIGLVSLEIEQDPDMLRHMKNLMNQYLNIYNPETKMIGAMFVTSDGAPGVRDIESVYGEDWYKYLDNTVIVSPVWGDRHKNLLLPTMQEAGRVTKEQEKWILEGCEAELANWLQMTAMQFGKYLMEINDADGPDIIKRIVEHNASFVNYFYNFKNNKIPQIAWICGEHFSGLKITRPGYYGQVGKYYDYLDITPENIFNLAKVYSYAVDACNIDPALKQELSDEMDTIWKAIRNMYEKCGFGDIGNPLNSIEPNLNLDINSKDTNLIRLLLALYNSTGNREYLNQARVIGNNIITSSYHMGYLVRNTKLRYMITDGEEQYVLLKLEEALLEETGKVPDSRWYYSTFVQEDGYDEYMRVNTSSSFPSLLTDEFQDVEIVEIRVDTENVELSVGDTHQLNLKIIPDDATNKTVSWIVEDNEIAAISSDNKIIAKKPGTTTAYAFNSGTLNVVSKPITITVR